MIETELDLHCLDPMPVPHLQVMHPMQTLRIQALANGRWLTLVRALLTCYSEVYDVMSKA